MSKSLSRQHTAEFMDITGFIAAGTIPEKTLPRTGEEVWQVRSEPIDFNSVKSEASDWTLVREGDLVRIRLIPYRTQSQDPAEYGLSAMDMAARLFLDFPQAVRIHIIFGKPVEDLRPEAEVFRFWVGVAIQLH